MGRPKGSKNRHTLGKLVPHLVRLTEEDYKRVVAAAGAAGVPVAAWIRRVVAEAAGMQTGGREMATKHDSESIWNCTFGHYETKETVLQEAERQGITPQAYAMACIVAAEEQGFTCDRAEAFASLCRQLGVEQG